MPILRPITDSEFAAWLETVVPEYAAGKVESGQWPAKTAVALSLKEYDELLPQGRVTENNHLFTVLAGSGEAVGTLWFVVKDRASKKIAYVCDILIAPEHRRRGYAYRAFQALEQEVGRLGLAGIALHVFGHNHAAQALYEKLGYITTNINMFKSLPSKEAQIPGISARGLR